MFTIKLGHRDGSYEVYECLNYKVTSPEDPEEWTSDMVLNMEFAGRADDLLNSTVSICHSNNQGPDDGDEVIIAYVMNSNGKTVDVIRNI